VLKVVPKVKNLVSVQVFSTGGECACHPCGFSPPPGCAPIVFPFIDPPSFLNPLSGPPPTYFMAPQESIRGAGRVDITPGPTRDGHPHRFETEPVRWAPRAVLSRGRGRTHKARYEAIGIEPPKGVLLYGPPARAPGGEGDGGRIAVGRGGDDMNHPGAAGPLTPPPPPVPCWGPPAGRGRRCWRGRARRRRRRAS